MATVLDLSSLGVLTRAATLSGCDLAVVLAELGISISADQTPFGKTELADVSKLLEALEASGKQRHFPFALADVFQFDGQPAILDFLSSAERLRDNRSLLDWVPTLIHPSIRFGGIDDGQLATVDIYVDDPNGQYSELPVFVEAIAAVTARVIRSVSPGVNALKTVKFAHAARTSTLAYEQQFDCPVLFSAGENQIVLDSQALDLQLPGSFPPAHAQAEETIRTKLVGDGVVAPLDLLVEDLLGQNMNLLSEGIGAVAQALKIQPRTLQRRLRDLGLSYSDVLLKTRHKLASEMLRETTLDIENIGFKLGFSERRSFTQAFQKWQGQTPSAYRKQSRG